MLSESRAKKIVDEITEVINQKISIIDAKGTILASSEYDRIGMVHEGAVKIIENHLESLVIEKEDEYSGGRIGEVYPIMVRGELMGCVAITGEQGEIHSYVQIIKHMTEILLLEEMQNKENEQMMSLRSRFISEWLHGEQTNSFEEMVERGKILGIDITIPRRILFMDVSSPKGDEAAHNYFKRLSMAESKLRTIFNELYGKRYFYILEKTYFVVGIPELSDDTIRRHIDQATKSICGIDNICFRIGIDGGGHDYTNIDKSYSEARRAWNSVRRKKTQTIRFYGDIDMEIFIDEISDETKWEYVHKIFEGFSESETKDALHILEQYYHADGSIAKASEVLYIHKNTLQKKLIKISERTGKDPRSHRYAPLYYNALYFYRYLN